MASGLYAETYRQQIMLRRGLVAHSGTVAVAVGVVVLPFLLSERWQVIGVLALIAGIGAVGLHLLTGLAGQVSLGHSAFLGVGAYTATWLGADQGLPLWLWLPGAGIAAAGVGAVIGPFAARFRGLYLAVVTLALVLVGGYVFNEWISVTGGAEGRSMVPTTIGGTDLLAGATIGGIDLTGSQAWWFFALAILVVLGVAARNLQRTRVGRAFASVRERDLAASVAGVPVTQTKVIAFVLAGFYAGVAGALLGSFLSYVNPGQWGLLLSIEYIAMIVIGGLGTVRGAIVGAAFVVAIPDLVRELAGLIPFVTAQTDPSGGLSVELVSQFTYGAVIVFVLVFEPSGLVGLWERAKAYLRAWPWDVNR